MKHFAYLGLLVACLAGTLPLELVLGVRVYARWRQLLPALVPAVLIFGSWDALAAARGWWRYDARFTVGVRLPGGLPLEEGLFFLVVPACAVLTLEAVRVRRPQWWDLGRP